MSALDEDEPVDIGAGWSPLDAGLTPQQRRDRLYVIIFGTETPAGRAFDIALLVVILLSILAVMLESVEAFERRFGSELRAVEWAMTIAFSVEYALRLYSARHRLRYMVSVFGIVDLLSILPTYLSLIFAGTHSLLVIRALRLLRVFRVLKVARMMGEAHALVNAIRHSMAKIFVFLGAVMTVVVIVGAAMYLVEGEANGFTSIPRSMYWAVVTMTTVGYGDIAPSTVVGQTIAAFLMIVGYGIIAVPTGIVSAELVGSKERAEEVVCGSCSARGHDEDASFCRICGTEL